MKRKNVCLIGGLAIAGLFGVRAPADLVTLGQTNGYGTTSFASSLYWSNGQAPSAMHDYWVDSGRNLRTQDASSSSFTFQGKSLTITGAGQLSYKGAGTPTITVNNLIVDNGIVQNATANHFRLAGSITVNSGGMSFATGSGGDSTLLAAVSGTGPVTFSGAGTVKLTTVTGIHTYTGNTLIGQAGGYGNVSFADGSQQRFKVQDLGVANNFSGVGTKASNTVTFGGTFHVDTLSLTESTGTWSLVNLALLTPTWGGTFGLTLDGTTSFTNAGGGVYTATRGAEEWSFDTGTGSLSVIPEPGSGFLLFAAAAAIGLIRRKLRG